MSGPEAAEAIEKNKPVCGFCNGQAAQIVCDDCAFIAYCNEDCMMADQELHATTCAELKEMREDDMARGKRSFTMPPALHASPEPAYQNWEDYFTRRGILLPTSIYNIRASRSCLILRVLVVSYRITVPFGK